MELLEKFLSAIKQHEGFYPGSRSFRNNNPGNLKYVGQAKATGKDAQGFAIFATLQDGESTLKGMILNAINGKSQIYNPEMSLLDFFSHYAPSADNNNPAKYAAFVAQAIDVKTDFQIKNLITQPEIKANHHIQLLFDNVSILDVDI